MIKSKSLHRGLVRERPTEELKETTRRKKLDQGSAIIIEIQGDSKFLSALSNAERCQDG